MPVRDVDRGYRGLLDRLRRRERRAPTLAVGIMSRHAGVLEAGIAAEFGTATEPSRSFLRSWFDANRPRNAERLREGARRVAAGENEATVLQQIGDAMAAEIRAQISAGIAPPLAPSTARMKGTNVPLIGGALEQSIEAEVRP